MCRILINLLSEFNDHNLIATLQLKPNKVVFLREKDEKYQELFVDIYNYLMRKQSHLKVVEEIVDKVDLENIEAIISKYGQVETIVNVSGGSKLLSLLTYEIALSQNMRTIFIDSKDGHILNLKGDSIEKIHQGVMGLSLNDLIEAMGGEVVKDSTQVFNEFRIHRFIRYIITHYKTWEAVKGIIRLPEFVFSERESLLANVYIDSLDPFDKSLVFRFLKDLVNLNIIYPYVVDEEHIHFYFKDRVMKNFIMISGSWLEALTFQVVESLDHITDVRSGVRFIWDETAKEVENELDVCAIKNNSFICISCKDTCKYDVDTLNELIVYAERIGGTEAIKILVTTSLPYKEALIKRAEEMGIHLVIFDGDIQRFKKKIEEIINS